MNLLTLLALQDVRYTAPGNTVAFVPAILVVLGILVWLVALFVGFGRMKTFGAAARWFVLSAVCLLLYHVHLIIFLIIAITIAAKGGDISSALSFGFFFNLFVVAGGVCAVIGFTKMNPIQAATAPPLPPPVDH